MFLGCSLVVSSLPPLSFPPSCPRAPQRSRHRASWRPAVTGCTIQTAEGLSRLQGFEKTDSPGRIFTLPPADFSPSPPLEERAGERRPSFGKTPTFGCRFVCAPLDRKSVV